MQAPAAPGKPLLLSGPVGWNPPCCLPYHASSGARTSGFVKRLRHCSRVKWPARAASLAEPGSSTHSNSLDSTNTNSLRRSLFCHTRAREQSSVRSRGVSPVKGHRPHTPIPAGWTGQPCWSNLAHPSYTERSRSVTRKGQVSPGQVHHTGAAEPLSLHWHSPLISNTLTTSTWYGHPIQTKR